MKHQRHLKLTLPLILAALATLGGWLGWKDSLFHAQDPHPDLTVTVVRRGNLLSAVTANGTIEPLRTVDIKYDVESPVDKLLVREGDLVRVGQILAVMDTSILDHTLVEAQQVMEKDETMLAEAKGQLERAEALARDQLIATAELDSDRANYQALVHQTHADAQNVMQIRDQTSRATLRSPINGIVIAVYVHQGEMLGSAAAVASLGPADAVSKPTNTLMTLAASGPLVVDADVNEVDLGGVRKGQRVEFVTDAFRPKIYHGRVSSVALQPTVINNVTTYRTTIAISDPDPRFRIGLPVNVMLLTEKARNAILIPPAALESDREGYFVTVFRPSVSMPSLDGTAPILPEVSGKMECRRVRVLAETSLAAAVTGTLQSSEWVVVGSANQVAQRYRIRFLAFNPNPSFQNFDDVSGFRTSSRFVPGPKPGGLWRRILGP
jgi:HlyD family secretion protein